MTVYVVPVVEGQTEQNCIERLLQRVWHELLIRRERLQVLEPFRGHRDELVHPDGRVLAETVQKASVKLQAKTRKDADAQPLILILLDSESDCPAALAPRLLGAAREALPADVPLSCVLAKRMLENWVVAGASTLAGVNGLPNPLPTREHFETRSGAAWLETQLRSRNKARKYRKTDHAEVFIRAMDLQECRDNSP